MRRALMMVLAGLSMAAVAHAADSIGLFVDAEHGVFYENNPGGMLYVFVNIDTHSMMGVEFKIEFDQCAVPGTVTPGPAIVFWTGTITSDWAGAFSDCRVGWWEVCHMPITFVGSCPDPITHIRPGDYADPHTIHLVDCNGDIWELNDMGHIPAAASTSWGVIKGLFQANGSAGGAGA